MADLNLTMLGLLEHVGQPGEPNDPANSDPGLPEKPPEGLVPVRIGTNKAQRIVYLDARQEQDFEFWRSLLDDLKEHKVPVRAEVDPATRLLSDLRLPIVTRVARVTEGLNGRWYARLDRATTRLAVSEDTDDGKKLLKRLRELVVSRADVMVTADYEQNRIIDIDDLGLNIFPDRGAAAAVTDSKKIPNLVRAEQSVLNDFYDKLRNDRCKLPRVGRNCLPVQWADNYCYGMADHMCNELEKPPFGIESGKVWLHGTLSMKSANRPTLCHYEWDYHVAAFVRLKGVAGEEPSVRIIDPAACIDGPLTLEKWRDRIEGHEEDPDYTPRTVFEQVEPGNYIGRNSKDSTAFYLSKMRAGLSTRVRGTRPEFPPYGGCPPDAPCP